MVDDIGQPETSGASTSAGPAAGKKNGDGSYHKIQNRNLM